MSNTNTAPLPTLTNGDLREIMSVLASATGTFVTGYRVTDNQDLVPVMTVLPPARDDKPASSHTKK